MRTYQLGHVRRGDNTSGSYKHRHRDECFKLTDDELDTHIFVPGTTGGGKSRFLWQLWREHVRNGRGCCIVEPGDLIDDLLSDIAYDVIRTGDRRILKKLHVVELSPYQLVRYDPFRFEFPKNLHPEMCDVVYRAWQHAKVQSRAEVYQWKQNQNTDFEGMPNLQRNMINVLTAVSTLVDGKRLSQGDADILIDLQHPMHDRVYQKICPHLDREIQSDFEILHAYRNVRDLRNDVGSLVNRFRSTHGPLLKEMISSDESVATLDLQKIIRQGEHLFVKSGKTPFVSNDQTNALAGMFIHDVTEAVFLAPRSERRPFTLMIDEFHKYGRAGIGEIARTARKYRLSLVMATPDLVSLKKNDLDLAAELLSVVNTVVSFRLTWPEDLEKMAAFLYAQNIDFTELVHEVERRAGPQWIEVDEWSEQYSKNSSRGTSSANTRTSGTSSQAGTAQGRTSTLATSVDANGRTKGTTRTSGGSDAATTSQGTSNSVGVQEGASSTDGESYGITVNHKLVHIEKLVREAQRTGMLAQSVADQFAKFAQQLGGHSRRRATVRVREREAVVIETMEVADRFRSPESRARAIEWIRRELFREHEYYFTPTLDPREQDRRLDAFVGDGTNQRDVRQEEAGANPLL